MTRTLVATIAIAALTCVSAADVSMGPTLTAGQTLHGRFVQERHLQGLASTLKSSGTFVLAPGKGLIWRVEDPIQTITVITPAS